MFLRIISTTIFIILILILIWLTLVDNSILPQSIFGYNIPLISNYTHHITPNKFYLPTILIGALTTTTILINTINTTNANADKINQLKSKYNQLTASPEWQQTDTIIKGTQIPGFADNPSAHEKVLESCRPFIQTHHKELANTLPSPDTIIENKQILKTYETELTKYKELNDTENIKKYETLIKNTRLDLYAPSIECSNIAKMHQTPAKQLIEKAHDTCITALQNKNPTQYHDHLAAITNTPLDQIRSHTTPLTNEEIQLKSNKLKQLEDCSARLGY